MRVAEQMPLKTIHAPTRHVTQEHGRRTYQGINSWLSLIIAPQRTTIHPLHRLLDPVWHFGPDVRHGFEQVLDDLAAGVAANVLDLLQLLVALLVGILLCLLVAAGVL